MNSTGVFADGLPAAISLEDDVYSSISELLDMIDYSLCSDTSYLVHDDALYNHALYNTDFQTWLYDKSNFELNDIKQELLQRIWRAKSIESEEELASAKNRLDCFDVGKPPPDFVWSVRDFLVFKQNRLKLIVSTSEFGREMAECFENIYFDEGVPASLNTLQTSFDEIRCGIVLHLRKLDEYYETLMSIRSGSGYDNKALAQSFYEYSHIHCSPQAGRSGVALLKRKYLNSKTGKHEEVICELHTKFSKNNKSRISDRIYFHPGKPDICEGKIIVIHIGRHL